MAFEQIEIIEHASAAGRKTGVSAGLTKIRQSPALLRITLMPEVMQKMGYSATDRFVALLGTGEDFGLLRLQKNKGGALRLDERRAAHEALYYMVSLKHRPEFVDRTEKALPCQWEKIDLTTIEVVLPAWADETNPHKKARIKAVPPEQEAARREAERLAQEQREARVRREERERKDTKAEMRALVEDALAGTDQEPFREILGLTPSERAVLTILLRKPGQLFSRERIATVLYAGDDEAPDIKIVDVMMSKIRGKLPPSVTIKTVFGEGWKITGSVRDLFEEGARA